MHISEGILSGPVLATGAALAIVGTGIGLKKMNYDKIPEVAILSSVFFVASLIHVPLGPTSVHLILNGLLGLLLGWAAFPAILVALFLQGILFQFGGLTTLGVNTINMALPAVLCYFLFRNSITSVNNWRVMIGAFCCGFLAVGLSGLMVALSLLFTGQSFLNVAKLILLAHLPIMVIEGLFTVFVVKFLKKVKPEMLEVANATN